MPVGGRSGISVAVLGPLAVEADGVAVALPSRLERAVVAALAARAGRGVAAEALAADVWGDDPAAGWRQNLTVTISRLRSRLAGALGAEGRDLVETVPDGYRLAIAPASIDAVRFEELAGEGRRLADSGSAAQARDLLGTALDLWRGAPLAEIADSSTGRAASARLCELREAVVDTWHESALSMGDHDAVVARLEASLVDEPLRERRWGQLMLALYRTGRQADALRAYQRARAVLGEELGLEPGPELRRLEVAILDHDPSLELAPADRRSARPAAIRDSNGGQWGHLAWIARQVEVPLVGRRRELARLVGHWERVKVGRSGGVVFIEGDAGVGKTRLAAEVALLAAGEGAKVLAGRCAPGAGLAALVPAAASAGVRRPDGDLGPGSPIVFEFGIEVAKHLVSSSVDQPTFLVLDDAQWADAQMISLFRQLSDRPLPLPAPAVVLAVVLVQRGFDVPPGMPELVRNIDRLLVSDRMVLDGLPGDEARALFSEQLVAHGAPAGDPTVEALVSDVGGNPRALIEHARYLAQGGDAQGVPDVLRLALLERLDAQAPDVVSLVLAAAVIGPTFGLGPAARAAGMDEDAALAAVERAVSARLLDEDDVGDYRFPTVLDRRVLLDRLSSARRRRIEARLGEQA